MQIRRATPTDASDVVALRDRLAFAGSSEGGFLLGTDEAGYRHLLAGPHAFVLRDDVDLRGVAIVLDDDAFRASDVFARRDAVAWSEDVTSLMRGRLAYYDQLGVDRGPYGRWGAVLALTALLDAVRRADHVVVTTVSAPVRNEAAVPYLRRLGGRRVGRIDEVYDGFGPLVSDLWILDADFVRQRVSAPRGLAERWVVDQVTESAAS